MSFRRRGPKLSVTPIKVGFAAIVATQGFPETVLPLLPLVPFREDGMQNSECVARVNLHQPLSITKRASGFRFQGQLTSIVQTQGTKVFSVIRSMVVRVDPSDLDITNNAGLLPGPLAPSNGVMQNMYPRLKDLIASQSFILVASDQWQNVGTLEIGRAHV